MRMNQPHYYICGEWIPASQAGIPLTDAGFALGVTIAEQLRTFAGKIFHLDEHLARLERSLDLIGVDSGMTTAELTAIAKETVAKNYPLLAPGDDLALSIVVTPGTHASYASGKQNPFICLHTNPLPFRLWAKNYETGLALSMTPVTQVSATCWPAEMKCRSRMHYYLADRKAAELDPGSRALLTDGNGFITEATTANIALYRRDEGLISPPLEKVLHGISLETAFRLAEKLGVSCAYRDVTAEDVAAADEVLLTSTPNCVLPVTRFNCKPIGDGRPGEMYRKLLRAWSEEVGVDVVAQAVRFAERE